MKTRQAISLYRTVLVGFCTLSSMAISLPVQAAQTDISTTPLINLSLPVPPNVFLMMDDSGSMDWDYMPDTVSSFGTSSYGYASSQCNGVYYDPDVIYTPPVKANGTSYPNATFTAAWLDGYNTGKGTLDLSSRFQLKIYQSDSAASGGSAAYYYRYTGSQTTSAQQNYYSSSSTFYKECDSTVGNTPGKNVFTKITVGNSEKTNFANWFSYYRTRLNMMKTATGLAFKGIDQRYRVGYATMNNNSGSMLLNLSGFDSAQKTSWYDMLYKTKADGGTPLLTTLTNVGLLYAKKLPSNKLNGVTANDPIQYSCQQNFTILATDGFWNNSGATNEGKTLDGSLVGNQDGTDIRPYNDGASTTFQKTTTQVQQSQTRLTQTVKQTQMRTQQLQTRTSTLQKRTKGLFGIWGGWNTATTCTLDANTQCQYAGWTGWGDTATCTAQPPSPSSPYTVGTARECRTTDTGWLYASACTSSSGSGKTVTCNSLNSGPEAVASCTPQNAIAGNNWKQVICTTETITAAFPVESCTAAAANAGNGYIATNCATVQTGPVTVNKCEAQDASADNNWTATSCSVAVASGGTSNTLADVAQYYYKTDLRTTALGNATGALGVSVAKNDVPKSGDDAASWQHMTTFTLGLGARGRMVYSPTYQTDETGDYYAVKMGLKANSSAGVCSWKTDGTVCNWPTPSSNQPETIDDLWHAAVNGRGTYFSATNPTSMASGLTAALASVAARTGGSAAATTSNPNVKAGDNFIFESSFTSAKWYGELVRRELNLTTGVPEGDEAWSARDKLDALTPATRKIYTYDSSASNHTKTFLWGSLSGSEQANFNAAKVAMLSQFCADPGCLNAAARASAEGANLVNFLRGERANEGEVGDPTKSFRKRDHVLGDIVNSEAAFIRLPTFSYADDGYAAFKTARASRAGRVYVAANDGMLHAFDTETGDEKWAYVPSMVLPELYRLADKNYANLHRYYTDATPVVGDVYFDGAWHTILVAGLNAGGTGYYALDVTDPTVVPPKVLWEVSDANMGYTFGNPVITKLKNGTWVVLVTSGYNNADGVGRLYVLNAKTGATIRTISTGVGSAADPSGLAKIAAWVDNAKYDNTAQRVYGGDLLGNIWRFDINGDVGAAGYDAQRLVTLVDSGGKAQPVTTVPELGVCGSTPLVFAGTGRYLGASDVANTDQQSFYAIKDSLGNSSFSNPRNPASGFVKQVQTTTTCPANAPVTVCRTGQIVRTSTNNKVSFPTNNGWYLDFPASGERANTDPTLEFGTLAFNTNVPSTTPDDPCAANGSSFQYFLNYCTGGAVSTAGEVASVALGSALATRVVLVKLPNNTIVALTRLSDGTTRTTQPPIGNSSTTVRRVSWRELINDQ